MDLKGKRLLIAGASRGLGAAAVGAFAQAGASLAIGARDGEALGRVAQAHQAVCWHAPCDFTSETEIRDWVSQAVGRLGGIDGLLVTVTAGRSASTVDDLDASYASDFKAPILLLRACLPDLRQNRGAALFCSSRTAHMPAPQTLAYGSAKAALEYATRCLAAETVADGVRVNAFALGSTLTEDGFWASQRNANTTLWRQTLQKMPQGRMGAPEDILAPMSFFLSDASRWITGQTLLIDGGQTLSLI